jgi:hypothetical protein
MSSFSFLSLFAELRVTIYNLILADTVDVSNTDILGASTSIRLHEYQGIILANKEVKREFEHEWVKAFNAWLLEAANQAEIQPTILPHVAAIVLEFPSLTGSS